MKNTHIASLSLKLLGIYSIIEAIPLLKVFTDYFLMQKTMTRFTGSEQASNATLIDVYIFIAGLVPFLILICLGVYLIKNSDIIRAYCHSDTKVITDWSKHICENEYEPCYDVKGRST
jgi:hypothetical protein